MADIPKPRWYIRVAAWVVDETKYSRAKAFLLYLIPCLIATVMILVLHYTQSLQASHQLAQEGMQVIQGEKDNASEPNSLSADAQVDIDEKRRRKLVPAAWQQILKVPRFSHEDKRRGAALEKAIKGKNGATLEKAVTDWTSASVGRIFRLRHLPIIVLGTLLPFLLLGWPLCFDQNVKKRIDGLSHDWKSFYHVRRGWGPCFALAVITAYSISFAVCPEGRAASTVEDFVKYHDSMDVPTYPEFFRTQNAEMAPVLAGMLGWYVHLLTTFFHRYVRRDVVSYGIHILMVQRFLIVLGVSMVIRVTMPGNVAIPFIVGIFPMSAVSFLVDLSGRPFPASSIPAPLSLLAVVPHGKIVRLAEEGIHDVADLASRRAEELSAVTTIPESCLDDWVDRAKLANVVGSQVYEQLRSRCWKGSYFLARCSDPKFREELESIGVKNLDEIAGLLNAIP